MKTCLLKKDNGEELSYGMAGAGIPVLLIHGITMWSEMWTTNGVVQKLTDRAKVIVPDIRGHGRSSRSSDPSRYGLELVSDLVEILDAEAIEKVNVVGFSLGAELALKLATTVPTRVSSIFLIGSGWIRENGMMHYREFASWARENGVGTTPKPDYDAMDALVEGMPEIIDVSKVELERINVPCAGLVGGIDPARPDLEALIGVVPDFELVVLPGVPHETSWRDPSIPERVLSFVDSAWH